MSNLKLLGAMFVFKGLELHNRSQKALWTGAQNAARGAVAHELNAGLRALFSCCAPQFPPDEAGVRTLPLRNNNVAKLRVIVL